MNLIFRVKRKFIHLFQHLYRQLFHRRYGEILMLHRVVENRSLLEDNCRLEVTPAFLEKTILKYIDAGYQLVSLDEVQQQLESRKSNKQKFVCFTLDDGYADNYKLAYPVFKKHNCPFAIYVATDFPDKKALLWHYHLQDILLVNEKVQFNGVEYDCSDLKKKNHAFRKIRSQLFTSDSEKNLTVLKQFFKENANVIQHDVNAVNWEQISELASDPLCTIGAHTVSHIAISMLNDEEVKNELMNGKKIIENRIKKPVKHFSYPFGRWDDRLAQLAIEYYSTATTTDPGFIRKGDNLDRLKRNELIAKPL